MKITNGGSPIVSQNCQVDEHTFLFQDGGGSKYPSWIQWITDNNLYEVVDGSRLPLPILFYGSLKLAACICISICILVSLSPCISAYFGPSANYKVSSTRDFFGGCWAPLKIKIKIRIGTGMAYLSRLNGGKWY